VRKPSSAEPSASSLALVVRLATLAASRAAAIFVVVSVVAPASGCARSAEDPRYGERKAGCTVKKFAGPSTISVDDLGVVSVDCDPTRAPCERQLLDAVCARGGDVAWGLGENALSATHLTAHAAHSHRSVEGRRERGCAVRVFVDAPTVPTDNVGPVTALCAADDSNDTCLRELQDQACLLGGDVVWQIEGPFIEGDRRRMRGRAAHSR